MIYSPVPEHMIERGLFENNGNFLRETFRKMYAIYQREWMMMYGSPFGGKKFGGASAGPRLYIGTSICMYTVLQLSPRSSWKMASVL